jgi:hypothetical protein
MATQPHARTAAGFHAAVAELIRLDAARAAEARTEQARIQRMIRLSDEMIAELEHDNLEGVREISRSWGPRLALLCADIPPRFLRRVGRLRTPSDAIDLIFEIQEHLLELKRIRRKPRPSVSWTRCRQSTPSGAMEIVWRPVAVTGAPAPTR